MDSSEINFVYRSGRYMKMNLYMKRLEDICNDFSTATGVSIYIVVSDLFYTDVARSPVNDYCEAIRAIPERHRECLKCDREAFAEIKETKKPCVYVCHGGLLNITVPILYEGNIEGYVIAYNVRKEGNDLSFVERQNFDIPTEEATALYESVPVLTEERTDSIVRMIELLADYLIRAGIIIADYDASFMRLKHYISDNIDKKLTVKEVAEGTNISKSSIYRILEKQLGCTLSEYINVLRIDAAEQLLVGTELDTDEIAKRCGFSSTVYFRQVFKKLRKTSPIKYRKRKVEEKYELHS